MHSTLQKSSNSMPKIWQKKNQEKPSSSSICPKTHFSMSLPKPRFWAPDPSLLVHTQQLCSSSLFRNKVFMLDEIVLEKCFKICHITKTQIVFFISNFEQLWICNNYLEFSYSKNLVNFEAFL